MHVTPLITGWSFRRCDPRGASLWAPADLPHCPFVADLDGREHWFGECEYRRALAPPGLAPGERLTLFVGAAMHSAVVLLDGRPVGASRGGYLPFEVDLTPHLRPGAVHELLLRLDNRDNPDVPPGKPYDELDFCWYAGLYRGAELRRYPPVHVTEAVSAGEPAGGGIFFRTLAAGPAEATAAVRVHVRNGGTAPWSGTVAVNLALGGRSVATATGALHLAAGEARHAELTLVVPRPALWSPARPHLHDLAIRVTGPAGAADERALRVGLRRVRFSRSGGLELNGERIRPRGTNRHQEYPRVGYAAGSAAQWRDARRIKEAGFDYVRCSHYPPHPAFLDACDTLGILVMDAIPGWQFIGNDVFREACFDHARRLIRRDRNHASVVLWELSLNETAMDEAFMARLHAIGHEEYPGDQMHTCGWIDRFDVFIHSRQHGGIHAWANGDRALVVAEYGDWEFYAANEGFDQKTGAGVLPLALNSRKLRGEGERALRQQLANHVAALADTLASPAVCDGQWAMFDYARGYDPRRAACGVMDLWRLPKFSYHFYRSQRSAADTGAGWLGGPEVFIASHWLPDSDRRVVVCTNCEEVELRLNGRRLAHEAAPAHPSLPHLPLEFTVPAFEPGALTATGFIGGRPVASHTVRTPGAPARLEVETDDAEHLGGAEPDPLLVHVRLLDDAGTLCVLQTVPVALAVRGDADLVGPASTLSEAGIASFVVRTRPDAARIEIEASASGLHPTSWTWHR